LPFRLGQFAGTIRDDPEIGPRVNVVRIQNHGSLKQLFGMYGISLLQRGRTLSHQRSGAAGGIPRRFDLCEATVKSDKEHGRHPGKSAEPKHKDQSNAEPACAKENP
jgi:hypothetical protein